MKNTIGHVMTLTLFGESHGPSIGVVIDGMPSGVRINEKHIQAMMDKRRAAGAISTARQEADLPQILSGVRNGFSEGTPITILIANQNVHAADYQALAGIARPSHADYTAQVRYSGFQDPAGGGHFSGRLTAPLVAAGAIFADLLQAKGILIGTHISRLHQTADTAFAGDQLPGQIQMLQRRRFPVLDLAAGRRMEAEILAAKNQCDSLGGILETAVAGFPAGVGEPEFDSLESQLSQAMFSIPAIKGIEFGAGFALADMMGSQANDPFLLQDGRIVTQTNHSGGINGGISNGMPIVFRTVIRPTPSIAQPQKTVNFKTMQEQTVTIHGRHDPAIIHRAAIVVTAMTAFVLADALSQRYGTPWLTEKSA